MALLAGLGCAPALAQTGAVEFNRDIRPILSDRCFACHGPDQGKRLSKLRLDTEAGAKGDLGGHFAIVPGKAADSELIRRVTSDDLARRMPPAYSGAAKLTEREIGLLTRWISQGATWQKHWSFIPPVRPELPEIHNASWPKNAIDRFVLARLEREGLKPSVEADARTLIRRVSFDLTGLPPTRRRWMRSCRIIRRMLTRRWWTACWPRRTTASAWRRSGWMRRGTRIPMVTRRMPSGPCGAGGIG